MLRDKKAIRYSVTTARILLALMFVFAGFSYFFMSPDSIPMDLATSSGQFLAALLATGYFLPLLKMVEGVCGLLLFSKRTTPLALIVLAPIIVQILLFNIFLTPFNPAGLVMGIVIAAFTVFLAWFNWSKYAPIFKA